jgi:hypothetical protein
MAFLLLMLAGQVTIPEGTALVVRLEQAISSNAVRAGDVVRLSVVHAVKFGGCAVIAQDALVEGRVMVLRQKASFGRNGTLGIGLERVRVTDGSWLRLRYEPVKPATPPTSSPSTAATTFGLLWYAPVAPLATLFAKGRDVSVPKATRFTVYTDEPLAVPSECR